MNYKIALGAGLLLFLLSNMTSCYKEEFCGDKAPLTGGFKIEEELGSFARDSYISTDFYDFVLDEVKDRRYVHYSETDTVLRGRFVHFTAHDEADRYEWTIGSDPRVFTGKHFSLHFFRQEADSLFSPTSLGVTLRVYRDGIQRCFPGDTVAMQHREMVVVPRRQSLVFGRYIGSSTRFPGETHEINIVSQQGTSIYNFPRNCTAPMLNPPGTAGGGGVICRIGYKSFTVVQGGVHYGMENCYRTMAIGELYDHKRLWIKYCLHPEAGGHPPLPEKDFVYGGIKVQ